MVKIAGKALILLLLYAPTKCNEKIEGHTCLQKMVFLFEKEVCPKFKKDALFSEEDLPRFKPSRYGPFSRQVFDDLEFLIGLDFVKAIDSEEQAEAAEYEEYKQWVDETGIGQAGSDNKVLVYEKKAFVLSDIGKKFVEEMLWPLLNDAQRQAIVALKENCIGTSINSILHYIQTKYPEFVTGIGTTSQAGKESEVEKCLQNKMKVLRM